MTDEPQPGWTKTLTQSGSFLAILASASALTLLAPLKAAMADTPVASDSSDGSIIVTARRRAEKAEDVPASLNVLTGAALQQTAITRLDEVQQVTPGLKVSESTISIRGVSNNIGGFGGSSSTAVQVDGIYTPRPYFILTEMFDVDRLEVLKGPQGTLYGRNATAGAINIDTRDPGQQFGADGYVGYGAYNLVRAEGGVDLPFENGGIRISGDYTHDDGYTKNLNPAGGHIDRQDYKGIRAKGVYHFTPTLKASATVQYVDDGSNIGEGGSNDPTDDTVFASLGAQRESPRRVDLDFPPLRKEKVFLFSGTLEADLGGVTAKSITGYVWDKLTVHDDTDGSGAFIEHQIGTGPSSYVSQEFNLSGGSPSAFSWTAGVYFSREATHGDTTLIDTDYPVIDPYLYFQQHTQDVAHSFAVFGEANYALTSKLSVTVGGRYTREDIDGSTTGSSLGTEFVSSAKERDHGFTPRFLLQYKPYEGGMLYASITRGLKGGGLNYSAPVATYRPEKLWAYEVGSKNQLFGGKASLDVSAFYYDYTDLQLRTAVFPPGEGVQIRVTNVAKADVYGAEGALRIHPLNGLTLESDAAYLHTELKNFISPSSLMNLSGLPLPLSPRWQLTAAAQYQYKFANAGSATVRLEYNYTSSVIFPALTDPAIERSPAYGLINASLRYDFPGDRLYVSVIGRNLTNKTYLIDRADFAGFSNLENFGAPRVVEGRIGFKF